MVVALPAPASYVPGVVERSSGKHRGESGSSAADQVVVGREQFDGDLVLGRPPFVPQPNVADLEFVAAANGVPSILRRQTCGLFR